MRATQHLLLTPNSSDIYTSNTNANIHQQRMQNEFTCQCVASLTNRWHKVVSRDWNLLVVRTWKLAFSINVLSYFLFTYITRTIVYRQWKRDNVLNYAACKYSAISEQPNYSRRYFLSGLVSTSANVSLIHKTSINN